VRSRFNVVIVLVYMAIAGSALGYMAVNMGGVCRFNSCLTLKVEFKDAAGLLHSNDVRVAGVQAGQVRDIAVSQNLALVTVQVLSKYQPVYRDATAIVRPKNLLGETYVEIDRGTPAAGLLQDGGTIHLDRTLTPVQVDEVLNALDPTTRDKLQIVINALGEATAQRGQDMNLSAADLQRISSDLTFTSATLDQESQDIDALLVQLDQIQQTSATYHEQLAATLRHWDDVSRTLQAHSANFSDAFANLDGLLATLDTGLTPNTPALAATIKKLPGTIDNASNFLGMTSKLNLTYLATPPGAPGPAVQDGIDLLPRLAQVMIGANGCDTHIYANYRNIPGTTEPAACPPAGSPLDDPFGGSEQAKGNSTTGGNRHLWRVMGMFDVAQGAKCGDLIPGGMAPSAAACAPGTNGTEPYQAGAKASTATGGLPASGGTASRPAARGGSTNFFAQLWADLTGAWNA
jgi:virulence factor Mce-like protein